MSPIYLRADALPGLLNGWVGPVVRETAHLQMTDIHGPGMHPGRIRELLLDLAVAECRDRVARVLAAAVGLVCDCTAPTWRRPASGGWTLATYDRFAAFHSIGALPPFVFHVPELATLDRENPDRLAVDAMALKLAAEHVGGR